MTNDRRTDVTGYMERMAELEDEASGKGRAVGLSECIAKLGAEDRALMLAELPTPEKLEYAASILSGAAQMLDSPIYKKEVKDLDEVTGFLRRAATVIRKIP